MSEEDLDNTPMTLEELERFERLIRTRGKNCTMCLDPECTCLCPTCDNARHRRFFQERP
jgi:hypothetical protein